MTIRIRLVLVLLSLSGSAMAEHGCPDGYVPVFQGGSQNRTCVVDYNLPVRQEQGQPVQQPQERWESRWGALADDGNGTMGAVTDFASKSAAQAAAITECKKRGGKGCKVVLAYYDQCAAAAVSTSSGSTFSAPTEEEAKSSALRRCEEKNGPGACWIYYSACSLPARVQ
jgi:hypothetical protein